MLIRIVALAACIALACGAQASRRRRRLRRVERHRRRGAGLLRLRARPPRLAGVGRPGGAAPEDGRPGDDQDQRARALPQPHQQGCRAGRRADLLREVRLQADQGVTAARRRAPRTCSSRPNAPCSGCRLGCGHVRARSADARGCIASALRPHPEERARARLEGCCVWCTARLLHGIARPRPSPRHHPPQRQDRRL